MGQSSRGAHLGKSKSIRHYTVLVLIKLKKINATALQPQRNVLKYFAIFKNVAHSMEPGETPRSSASHQLQTMYYVPKFSET